MKKNYWNVSTIARKLNISTAAVNIGLINLGFQRPGVEFRFELTKRGEQFGKFIFIKSKTTTRLKWLDTVIPLIMQECQNIEKPREEMRLLKRIRHAYILELENDCYYVGSATDLKKRLREHFEKKPKIKWIIKNPVVRVVYAQAIDGTLYDSYDLEDRLSLGLAKSLGVHRVRGGRLSGHPDIAPVSWSSMIGSAEPVTKDIFTVWLNEQSMKLTS